MHTLCTLCTANLMPKGICMIRHEHNGRNKSVWNAVCTSCHFIMPVAHPTNPMTCSPFAVQVMAKLEPVTAGGTLLPGAITGPGSAVG